MKRFSIKVIVFNLILILLFCMIIVMENLFLNRPDYFKLPDETKFIVLGHSHPECAFNDSLINHLANFGYSAESYFYTYFKAKKLIENNKQIEAVFLEFTNNQILKEWDTTWRWDYINLQDLFPKYFPYMSPTDLRTLWTGNHLGVLSNLPKSAFNNLIHSISVLSDSYDIKKEGRFGGFLYLPYARVDSLIANSNPPKSTADFKIAEINLIYLKKIIELCKQKKVKVYLIRSPLHSEWPELNLERRYKEILNSSLQKVEFLDFKDFPLHNSEFGDLSHLNGRGAKKFSVFFDNLLDKNLLEQKDKQAFVNNEIKKILRRGSVYQNKDIAISAN